MLAKGKGVAARRGLKEAWSKAATRWTRTGYEAVTPGRVGEERRSPHPPRGVGVNPAGAWGRRASLPREGCCVSGPWGRD